MKTKANDKWFVYGVIGVIIIIISIIIGSIVSKAHIKPDEINSWGVIKWDSNNDGQYDNSDVYITAEDFYYLYELAE